MPTSPQHPDGAWMPTPWTDGELVLRIQAGDTELFELLIRRHNMRLFRTIRTLLLDDAEAEDALQLSYLKAWQGLNNFGQRSSFITWITRIAIREAGAMRTKRERREQLEPAPRPPGIGPDHELESRESVQLLEEQIQRLPEGYRQVFVLCAVQCVPPEEVAQCLKLSLSNVRVRLHRARLMLQERISPTELQPSQLAQAWAFAGERCQRTVTAVLAAIRKLPA